MNTSPPTCSRNIAGSPTRWITLDHTTKPQRAAREGPHHSEQLMQPETNDPRRQHRQPEPPWQID